MAGGPKEAQADTSDLIVRAVTLRLLAAALVTTMNATIKLAETRGAHFAEIIFFRQAVAVPLVATVVALGPGLRSVATRRIGAHVVRAIVGLSSMACLFASLLVLPLAEATTFQFTVPIFATILGALVLREPTGWHRWSAVAAGFFGVLIVARPGSGHIALLGATFGLGAALSSAIVSILLRQIGRTESAQTTVFWFSTLSVPPLAVLYAFYVAPHPPTVWALLVAIGLIGGAGQLALTASLRHAPVSIVLPMDYAGLIWATFYGWLLFAALPDRATWLGAPLIIASGLYIVWREHRLRRAKTDRAVAQG